MPAKYITIVGADFCFGITIYKVGQELLLKKDRQNRFDDEAIEVVLKSVDGRVGYVANSCHTVAKGTGSAGRIYDSFEEERICRVAFITSGRVIAELIER